MAEKNSSNTENTIEQLEQELLQAKAQIGDLKPDAPKKAKPYTKAEIDELHKEGHHIGVPGQRLSTGHDETDLQEWEEWVVEIMLKDIGKIPETGQEWSVPDTLTPQKLIKGGMKGNDKTFQWRNKQLDFRYPASEHRYIILLPKGFKSGQKYECHYWVEEIKHLSGVQKEVRLLVKDSPKVTGAPTDSTKWGKG